MTSRRLGGLDRLRGAALVLMLVHHFTDWYGGNARAVLPGWPGFALTDVAAPAFTIALGASVPLLLASRRRRGLPGWGIAVTTARRYGLLIPIGVALRAAMGFDLGHVGVLETLGLCALVVAAVTVVTSPSARLAVAVAVTVGAPFVERAACRSPRLALHAPAHGHVPVRRLPRSRPARCRGRPCPVHRAAARPRRRPRRRVRRLVGGARVGRTGP